MMQGRMSGGGFIIEVGAQNRFRVLKKSNLGTKKVKQNITIKEQLIESAKTSEERVKAGSRGGVG